MKKIKLFFNLHSNKIQNFLEFILWLVIFCTVVVGVYEAFAPQNKVPQNKILNKEFFIPFVSILTSLLCVYYALGAYNRKKMERQIKERELTFKIFR